MSWPPVWRIYRDRSGNWGMVQVLDSGSSRISRGLPAAVLFWAISVLLEDLSCVFQIFTPFACGTRHGKEANRVIVEASRRDQRHRSKASNILSPRRCGDKICLFHWLPIWFGQNNEMIFRRVGDISDSTLFLLCPKLQFWNSKNHCLETERCQTPQPTQPSLCQTPPKFLEFLLLRDCNRDLIFPIFSTGNYYIYSIFNWLVILFISP